MVTTKEELLSSNAVWRFFDEITKIPRPSKHEERISSYLMDFARSHGVEARQDGVGNVLMSVSATPGCEGLEPIILQAHMDMVCEKNADVSHDFMKDPIDYYVADGWVRTHGTTLGADDGIGVASALAVISEGQQGNLRHGPLYCLFTVDEETGLTGAYNLGSEFLPCSRLVNLDSEDEGQIFIGCAGGCTTTASFPLSESKAPVNVVGVVIRVGGLMGGHSGGDIHLGRANANQVMARFVQSASLSCGLRISSFDGGNLHNAIPREAVVHGVVPFSNKEKIRVELNVFASMIEEEYEGVESGIRIDMETEQAGATVMSSRLQQKLIDSLVAVPNGVLAMSHTLDNLVQTSTNLASVKTMSDRIEVVTSQRSSLNSGKDWAKDSVSSTFRLAEAEVVSGEGYPSWKPNTHSALLSQSTEIYRELFGEEAQVLAIHAGLECGLFLDKRKDLDMISIGPTLRAVHSPDERVDIASVEKYWLFLKELLSR